MGGQCSGPFPVKRPSILAVWHFVTQALKNSVSLLCQVSCGKNRFDNCGKKLYFFQDTDWLLFPNNMSHMIYQCLLFLPRLPGNSQLPLRLRPARFSPSGGPVLLFLCSMYHVSSTVCVCMWQGGGGGQEDRQKDRERPLNYFPRRLLGHHFALVNFVHFKPADQHWRIICPRRTDPVYRPPQQQMAPPD